MLRVSYYQCCCLLLICHIDFFSVRGTRGSDESQFLLRNHFLDIRRQIFQLRSLHDLQRLSRSQSLGPAHGIEADRNVHGELRDLIEVILTS